MEFCIITPTIALPKYATLSRTHLLLCQIQDPNYWNFYSDRWLKFDTIILDNGAYEGQSDWARLVDRIRVIQPHIASLPDYLCEDWKKTWHAATQFLDSYFYEFDKVEWMYIPQASPGDILGFVDGLYSALEDERISHIGLPRALAYRITQDPWMRVRVAEQIKKRSQVGIHALGMVKGNHLELRALRESGCVRSCDSSAPVWRGWHGFKLTDRNWPEIPVDFEINRLPSMIHERIILDNLEECGISCQHKHMP